MIAPRYNVPVGAARPLRPKTAMLLHLARGLVSTVIDLTHLRLNVVMEMRWPDHRAWRASFKDPRATHSAFEGRAWSHISPK